MGTGNRKNIQRKFIYLALAVVVFTLLSGTVLRDNRADTERTSYNIVVLGDSLLGECRDETSIVQQLSEMLGKSVYNGAFGGTCMVSKRDGAERNYSSNILSIASLSWAIAADDFGAQRTVRSRQPATEYFQDTLANLEKIDFDAVELLLIECGLNDYHSAVAIDNEKAPLDEGTFMGAVRSVVAGLKKAYPDMRIVMVTPTYTWYLGQSLTCEEYDLGNGYLEKYVDALLCVADELDLDVIDLYHDVYPHDVWEDWSLYTIDGVHPNGDGRKLLAERMAERLRDML